MTFMEQFESDNIDVIDLELGTPVEDLPSWLTIESDHEGLEPSPDETPELFF